MCDKCKCDTAKKVDVLLLGKVVTEDVKEIIQNGQEVVHIKCPSKNCSNSVIGKFTDGEIVSVESAGMNVVVDEGSMGDCTLTRLIVIKDGESVSKGEKYHLTCSSECGLAVSGGLLGLVEKTMIGKIRKMTVTVDIEAYDPKEENGMGIDAVRRIIERITRDNKG